MSSAQPKYDPSMDELLASIRRIMSADEEAAEEPVVQKVAAAGGGRGRGGAQDNWPAPSEPARSPSPSRPQMQARRDEARDDLAGLDPDLLPKLIEQSILEAFPESAGQSSWDDAAMDAFSAALESDDEDDRPTAGLKDFTVDDWPDPAPAPAEDAYDWAAEEQDTFEAQDVWQDEPVAEQPVWSDEPVWDEEPAPEPEPEPTPVYRSFRDRLREEKPAPEPEPRNDMRDLKAEGDEIRRLLSSNSSRSIGSAFDSLARSVERESPADSGTPSSGRTLEDVVADCLRPMLRTWLDENLPSLVERLVQEEIDRVARKNR